MVEKAEVDVHDDDIVPEIMLIEVDDEHDEIDAQTMVEDEEMEVYDYVGIEVDEHDDDIHDEGHLQIDEGHLHEDIDVMQQVIDDEVVEEEWQIEQVDANELLMYAI